MEKMTIHKCPNCNKEMTKGLVQIKGEEDFYEFFCTNKKCYDYMNGYFENEQGELVLFN